MRKVKGDLSSPGVCFICMATRVIGDEFMVETGALNDYGVVTPRTGVVYVCNACIDALAKEAGGYVKMDEVERERGRAALAAEEIDKFREELRGALGSVEGVLERSTRTFERLANEASKEG